MDEVFAGEELVTRLFRPASTTLRQRAAKLGVAHLVGHRDAGFERGQEERADPGDGTEPGGIERVDLLAFEQAVAVGVLAQDELDRRLIRGQLRARKDLSAAIWCSR